MSISEKDLLLENKKLESTIDIIRNEISLLSADLYDKETELREFQTMMWDNRAELDPAEMKTLRTSNDMEVFFLEQKAKKFKKLYQIQNKPYFGRIDFESVDFPYTDDDLADCVKGEKLIYYETSRGCPFSCSYCLSSVESGVRFLPVERVKNEIKKITSAGALTIKFVDRTFNADRKRALEIWKFCASLEGKTKYHFEIGADLLDKESLEFLKTVPKDKFLFEVGVQSTNEKTLGAVCRKTDLQKIKDNVLCIKEQGNIHLHLDLIAGLPFEGYESFKRSFNDLIALKPHELQLGFLKFLKGSGIRKSAETFGGIYSSEAPYEVLKTDYISAEEIIKLHYVEDVLERYYNSERFENSIFYGMELFETPFDFFEALSEFFVEKNLIDKGIKRISLYELLYDFIKKNSDKKSCEEFRKLLKKDFELWHSNGVGTPEWYKI